MNDSMINTGLRIPSGHLNRAQELADTLGVTRNRLIALLIEKATVESKPVIKVNLGQQKSVDASYQASVDAFSGAN